MELFSFSPADSNQILIFRHRRDTERHTNQTDQLYWNSWGTFHIKHHNQLLLIPRLTLHNILQHSSTCLQSRPGVEAGSGIFWLINDDFVEIYLRFSPSKAHRRHFSSVLEKYRAGEDWNGIFHSTRPPEAPEDSFDQSFIPPTKTFWGTHAL